MTSLTAKPFSVWWRDGDSIEYLTLDATLEEEHRGEATISKYPVQRGFEVSDHMIRHNRKLVVKGVVTNIDIGGIDADGATIGGNLGHFVGGVRGGQIGSIVGGIAADPKGVAGNYVDGAITAAGTVLNPAIGVVNSTLEKFGKDKLDFDSAQELISRKEVQSKIRNMFDKIIKLNEGGYLCQVSTMLKTYDPVVLVSYKIPQTLEYSSVMLVELEFEEIKMVDYEGQEVKNAAIGDVTDNERDETTKKAKQTIGSNVVDKVTGFFKDGVGKLTKGSMKGVIN